MSLRELLESSPPDLVQVFASSARFAFGRYRSFQRAVPMASLPLLSERRAECAARLRRIRRLRHCRPSLAMLGNLHVSKRHGWWRWVDDHSQRRKPWDFSAQARQERAVELLARFLDGSLMRCAIGECPRLPIVKFLEQARELLSPPADE